MNDLLRDKVADVVVDRAGEMGWHWEMAQKTADAILAIPEIATALALKADYDAVKLGHTTI